MTATKPDQVKEQWRAAEAALRAARSMPGGADRFDALRRAGQLRYDADQRRREIEQEAAKNQSALRRGPKSNSY